jgi:RNA polymerase sigma-70 factor (ECF subfamily)
MVQPSPTETVHNGQSPGSAGGWDLVTRAQQGDRDAFGQLYQRYARSISRFLASRVTDRGLTEDLTSETFLRAWRRINTVHNQGHDIGAWLTTIARNLVVDHVKSSRHRLDTTTANVPEHPTTAALGPEQAVIQRDTTEWLWRCIAQLTPDQRECIRLRVFQDLSIAQTATVMGRTQAAVRALRHRAVAQLREAMTSAPTEVPAAHDFSDGPMARARQAVAHLQAHRCGRDRRIPAGQARPGPQAHWQAEAQQRSGTADGVGVA